MDNKRIHQEFLEPLWTMKMGQVNTLMLSTMYNSYENIWHLNFRLQ